MDASDFLPARRSLSAALVEDLAVVSSALANG